MALCADFDDLTAVRQVVYSLAGDDEKEKQKALESLCGASPQRLRLFLRLFGFEDSSDVAYTRKAGLLFLIVGFVIGLLLIGARMSYMPPRHKSIFEQVLVAVGISCYMMFPIWYIGIRLLAAHRNRLQAERLFGPEARHWRVDPRLVSTALEATRNPAHFEVLLEARRSHHLRVRTTAAILALLPLLERDSLSPVGPESWERFCASVLSIPNAQRSPNQQIELLRFVTRIRDPTAEPYARALVRARYTRKRPVFESAIEYLRKMDEVR